MADGYKQGWEDKAEAYRRKKGEKTMKSIVLSFEGDNGRRCGEIKINWVRMVSVLGGSIPIVTALVVAILGRQ